MSKMTPINCCCDARKTLGFVPLDQRKLKAGQLQTFCAMNADNDDQLTLPVGSVTVRQKGHTEGQLTAIKSMDTPMEALRQIPGFVEFHSDHEVGTRGYAEDQGAKYEEYGMELYNVVPACWKTC